MADINLNRNEGDGAAGEGARQISGLTVFDSLDAFARAVRAVTGEDFDFKEIMELDTDFIQASEQYLLLNIKEYGSESPNNLLFLNETRAYAFSGNLPTVEEANTFADVLLKPYGKSTVLSYFIFDKVLDNHKLRLEALVRSGKQLEDHYDHVEYRNLALEFERLGDRLEELHALLIRLQERYYKQIETHLIVFDYRVLLAESLSLQGRCRRRAGNLKELRQEHEVRATEELNQRIVKLNDVVKKLTALTVILMIPTLIASHFGMNFAYMPELRIPWVYPAVVVFQLVLMGVGFWLFRRIGWL